MADLALILLPGLDGSGLLFRPLLNCLPPEIRPIVLSYPANEPLGYAELLPRVLAALPAELPFALLGESFSGPLALMAAATRPPNLVAVILCASFVRNPLWFRPNWLHHLVRPFVFRFYPKLILARSLLAGYSTPETRRLALEALSGLAPEVLAHRVRAVMGVNVLAELSSCPVPLLYLRAKYDLIVPRHNLATIIRERPDVQAESLPAPHTVLQTQPALAAAAIMKFVAGIC